MSRFQVGSRVLIRNNPHEASCANVLGIVTDIRPREGCMGYDLYYVGYSRLRDGAAQIHPFIAENLELGSFELLNAVAEVHEAEANQLRHLARQERFKTLPVIVPETVRYGIEAIRLSTLTDMNNYRRVAELADEMGCTNTASWIRENRSLYSQALVCGFEVAD